MTTTELKEPSTPAGAQTEDSSTNNKSAIAKKLSRQENVPQERDKESFYKDLQNFHENRNTTITRFPKISGKEVDLHKLYSEVISRGGWMKVNLRSEWEDLTIILGLTQTCVNASVALKNIYARFLDKYEKLNFLGEDPDRKDDMDDDNRHKKWSSKNCIQTVPMTYNYNQHNVSENQRIQHKLSTNLYKSSEYEKLLMSLMSPLPNEQDFAINVCTLMANEGKHTLKIENCPKLLDYLMAHAGVYSHQSMRNLFQEFYSGTRRQSLQAFWNDLLQNNTQILELSFEDYFQASEESESLGRIKRQKHKEKEAMNDSLFAPDACEQEEDTIDFDKLDFLALGRGLGTHEYIGQRVQQIAFIIRNLSFFDENLALLAKNRTFMRFLIMSSNIRWGNIHHMALDICGNIANEIELLDPASDELTRCLLASVCDGLEGQDRGVIISCLEILNKLSQRDSHDNYLHKCIDQKMYNQICLFLSLNDIMLLLYTLECIYALSSLGHRACNSLVQVRGIIDTLISLITVEAQSYGPDGCILMRVVETVPGNMLPMVAKNIANLQNVAMHGHIQQQTQNPNLPPQENPPKGPANVPQQVFQNQVRPTGQSAQVPIVQTTPIPVQKPILSVQENEQFAISWLTATFEIAPSAVSRVEQQELYKMYISAIHKSGRRGSVTPSHFPRIVRSIFGTNIGPTMLKITDTNTGIESTGFYYICVRVRANPLPLKGSMSNQQSPLKIPVKQQQQPVQLPTTPQLQAQPASDLVNKQIAKDESQHTSNSQLAQQKPILTGNPNLNQGTAQTTTSGQIIKTTTIGQTTMTSTQISNVSCGTGGGGIGGTGQFGTGTPNSTSLIKSLLANKVTTTSSTASTNIPTETLIASAASNNPSGLIVQNVKLNNQLAQRQNLAKQKEVALQQQQLLQQQQQHQQQQSNVISTPIKLATTTISALVNNPIIQSTPVKVGQTTIKPINPNTIEKKTMIVPSESMETGNWDPVPPLAPLSSTTVRSTILISGNSGSLIGHPSEDSNSTGNNSMSSSIISSSQIQMTDDGEGSVISFEGLLIPKSKSGSSSTADDENSKDSMHKGSSHVINANQMLVDLLDKKSPDPPLTVHGVKRKLADDAGNGSDKKKILVTESIVVTPSQNAANLYAEMAASILEDEDLEETSICVPQSQLPKIHHNILPAKSSVDQNQKQIISVPLQRQIIMSPNNQHPQMILQQNQSSSSGNTQQTTATIKTDSALQTIPLILQKQIGPNGQQIMQPIMQHQQQSQTQYVLATNPQGQTYLVAQQAPSQQQQQQQQQQTLLVTQQQGTPTKTIIILQQQGGPPQAVAQQQIIGGPGQPQKMIMTTPQGQQMIVTQMPRQVQHHQIIMNPGTSVLQTSGTPVTSTIGVTGNLQQNLIFTQSGSVFHHQQQSQQVGQMQKQIQIHQQQSQPMQIQQTLIAHQQQQQLTALQQQQQASLLSQLPQIPATIKLHSHQPSSASVIQQTQTTQTPTIKMIAKPPQQQSTPIVSIVAQTPTQPPLLQQPQMLHGQNMQQVLKAAASSLPIERKQVIVTGSEIIKQQIQQKQLSQQPPPVQPVQQQQQSPQIQQAQQSQQQTQNQLIQQPSSPSIVRTPTPTNIAAPSPPISQTPATIAPPPPRPVSTPTPPVPVSNPTPPPPISPALPKPKTDEELIDLNWLWICDWRGCPRKRFKSLQEVYRHACLVHCPDNLEPGAEIFCQWGPGQGLCDHIPRKRFSLMTHILDRHCTVEVLKAAVSRRLVTGLPASPGPHQPVTIIKNNMDSRGTTASPTLSTSSNSSLPSAASAAMHAIKRYSTDFINPKELMDENEGPVTKSIRLTAALILRNLVTYTSAAKRNIRFYEPHLAGVALSNVESSRTISQILYELNN